MDDETGKLTVLQDSLTKAVIENWGIDDTHSDIFAEKFMELFELCREECETSCLQGYKQKAPILLADFREMDTGFESRNYKRWATSFDHLEMVWTIAQELGEMHGKEIKAENGNKNNEIMAALAHIFPRALLVAREIICLLKGGFPDGALTRWRSLHELAVTAKYIRNHEKSAVVSYLMSFHFSSRRAAHQMNEFANVNNMNRFSKEELGELDAKCSMAEEIIGQKIKNDKDGEWPKILQNRRNFADIEKDVGMDHYRPLYKWASTHTHANHHPMEDLLGQTDSSGQAHLVGQSNSGLVVPFQLTATTLGEITTTYLSHGINVDLSLIHI